MRFSILSIFLLTILLGTTQTSDAQVPPHVPGTVCMTPDFWCWAKEQGEVGVECECELNDATLVSGVYG